MSALRQPNFHSEYYTPRIQLANTDSQHQEVATQPLKKPAKTVCPTTFPTQNSLPKQLKTLSLIQKGSFGLAIASMTVSVGLYISTVQIPKLWSQEYRHLEDLQLQERQLIAINETMKYQIAREASKNSDLSVSQPESALFISPAKVAPKKLPATAEASEAIELEQSSLGY